MKFSLNIFRSFSKWKYDNVNFTTRNKPCYCAFVRRCAGLKVFGPLGAPETESRWSSKPQTCFDRRSMLAARFESNLHTACRYAAAEHSRPHTHACMHTDSESNPWWCLSSSRGGDTEIERLVLTPSYKDISPPTSGLTGCPERFNICFSHASFVLKLKENTQNLLDLYIIKTKRSKPKLCH